MAKYRITVTALPDSELPVEKVVDCDGYSLIGFTNQVGDQCDMDIDMRGIRDVDLRSAIRNAAPLRKNAIALIAETVRLMLDTLLDPEQDEEDEEDEEDEDDTPCYRPDDDEEDEEDAAE